MGFGANLAAPPCNPHLTQVLLTRVKLNGGIAVPPAVVHPSLRITATAAGTGLQHRLPLGQQTQCPHAVVQPYLGTGGVASKGIKGGEGGGGKQEDAGVRGGGRSCQGVVTPYLASGGEGTHIDKARTRHPL